MAVNMNPLTGFALGESVDGWMFLQDAKVKTAKTGSQYIHLEGLDAKGRKIKANYYPDRNVTFPTYEAKTVIEVKGQIGHSRDGLIVYVQSAIPVSNTEDADAFRKICYPAVPPEKLDKIIADLEGYSRAIIEPGLLKLSSYMFEYFRPFLPLMPAGKEKHEPVRGGLALHTWQILTLLNNQLFIPVLDSDVLFFAALYHDIGKTQEYTEDLTWAPYGRLYSHVPIAIEIMQKMITQHNIVIPEVLLRHVKHCLMSHHGKDFGYDKPCTREAVALHFADHLMATIGHIEEHIRLGNVGEDGWGIYSSFLESTIFVPQLIK